MSFTDKKRKEIKKYILRKIANDDECVIAKTMDNFEISITTVKRYLKEAEAEQAIEAAPDRKCGYRLVEQQFEVTVCLEEKSLEEDRLFEMYIARHLINCNEAALRIWQYTCAEMLNNAIEHSKGSKIQIKVYTNILYTRVFIVDDGIGIFKTLLEYMETHGWERPTTEDALIELYKGKITSKEDSHSGEGIFFSSKMMDDFWIWSDASVYHCGTDKNPKTIQAHLLAYASRLQEVGTMVIMCLENETQRKIVEVFRMYTDIEDGFIKTRIPIKEACINGEPVARSQARRIAYRLEAFREVILDFRDVEFMGQGFADELFRVYALAHPEVLLEPVNMHPDVERMIRHVGRGILPQNVNL